MATRNRTILFRKYRDALKSVRISAGGGSLPSPSSSSSGGGPVIELSTTSLLHPNRAYTPLSTEDPGTSRSGREEKGWERRRTVRIEPSCHCGRKPSSDVVYSPPKTVFCKRFRFSWVRGWKNVGGLGLKMYNGTS